jgi:hypothetical protein
MRAGDQIDWLGALYALQTQAGTKVHVGGRTALGLTGQAHYVELNAQTAQLFGCRSATLPPWFTSHDWGVRPELHRTDFLPPNLGLVDVDHKLYTVAASGAGRACMECLYLAPGNFDLVEAYQIVEGLATLRPDSVQVLLEACRSVKVTRLFLFMAEQANHPWAKYLDVSKIKLGTGKRTVALGGAYVSKYQITVPRELVTR